MFNFDSFLRSELGALSGTERGKVYEDKLRAYWDTVNESDDLAIIQGITDFARFDMLTVLALLGSELDESQAVDEQLQMEMALDRLAIIRGREVKKTIWN